MADIWVRAQAPVLGMEFGEERKVTETDTIRGAINEGHLAEIDAPKESGAGAEDTGSGDRTAAATRTSKTKTATGRKDEGGGTTGEDR